MIDPEKINSVIFDFDGTLCSSRYFEPLGRESLDAISTLVFGDNSPQWADPWMRGEITSADIASYLSKHIPVSANHILTTLQRGCSKMSFNPAVYRFALSQRKAGRKTALVTANMDVFTEIVVPAHGLDTVFDIVLNTSDHGSLDKSSLWSKALSDFGDEFSFASSLLIDDNARMVALFESLGGNAYQYKGDQAFEVWLDTTCHAQ